MSFRIEGIAFGSGKLLILCYGPKGYLETGEYHGIEGILSRLSFTNSCQSSNYAQGFPCFLGFKWWFFTVMRREREVLLWVFAFYGVLCMIH